MAVVVHFTHFYCSHINFRNSAN